MVPWLFSSGMSLGGTQSAATARDAAHDATMPLERRIEHLELVCAGLWELCKFKLNCTDQELMDAIHHVDARDGVVDGKAGPTAGVCPSCGRKLLTRKSPKCAWCGAPLQVGPFG